MAGWPVFSTAGAWPADLESGLIAESPLSVRLIVLVGSCCKGNAYRTASTGLGDGYVAGGTCRRGCSSGAHRFKFNLIVASGNVGRQCCAVRGCALEFEVAFAMYVGAIARGGIL